MGLQILQVSLHILVLDLKAIELEIKCVTISRVRRKDLIEYSKQEYSHTFNHLLLALVSSKPLHNEFIMRKDFEYSE